MSAASLDSAMVGEMDHAGFNSARVGMYDMEARVHQLNRR